jgi:hypothetical protein
LIKNRIHAFKKCCPRTYMQNCTRPRLEGVALACLAQHRGLSPKPAKLDERIQKLDRAGNFEKSYPAKLNREDREDRKEDIFLWAPCLSFTPDHALDSILDVWDLPVNLEADGTSAQLETGKQLGPMDGMDHIDSFVFNEPKKLSLRSLRSLRFKIQKTNQRNL